MIFAGAPPAFSGRVGIGPAVPVLALPGSGQAAGVALRFAAEGTENDPAPAVIRYAGLGA